MPHLEAHGIQRALEILEREVENYNTTDHHDGSRILGVKPVTSSLHLSINTLKSPPAGDDDDHPRGNTHDPNELWWSAWSRFVTRLQQSSTMVRVWRLSFFHVCFLDRPDDDDGDDEAFTRLFRDVLPTLPSLTFIDFHRCKIPSVYLDNIARQLHNLESLTLCGCSIDSTSCELILKALDEGNTCLQSLNLSCNKISADAMARLLTSAKNRNAIGPRLKCLYQSGCSIDSPSCELILKALDGNTHLESLNVSRNDISDISLEAARALGNCRSLDKICLSYNPLSDPSLCHLVEGLRTTLSFNTPCVKFSMSGGVGTSSPNQPQIISPTSFNQLRQLDTHNQQVRTHMYELFQTKGQFLRYKGRATTTGCCHVSLMSIWPLLLGYVRNEPFFIYRFVRHGNLESFTGQVISRKKYYYKY